MKYADAPTVEGHAQIAAQPARVWQLVSDIETPSRFSPELYEVEWLDGATAPAPGAEFVGRNRSPSMGRWQTTARITAVEPQRAFTWSIKGFDGRYDPPAAAWGFELSPQQEGTRLRQWTRIGPGRSGVSLAIESMPDYEELIVARRLEDLRGGIQATLAGIKALAENG